ncbi:uncharacterized protein LOC112142036 [Oryzias melastigma]|uniref:uncharacterized protein LOC112142036 n=1 Tax=Oryzias melastigma TaxID=30732 RepID=UPI00168CE33D|nr:uncharacterized protein LOC112142036 [Oryzias melastigma]
MTMPLIPMLGILFLASWFPTDVYSEKVLDVLEGFKVVLSPGVIETAISSITWKHGPDLAAEWFGGIATFYPRFNGRCSLNTRTGEMMINDLRLEDEGSYTPEINNNVRAAVTLRVFSPAPVPKPNITHDCKSKQTKCTLTCTFDRTEDMGGVEVFWIRDNRRGKGGGALEITEETKEKTFICSLENSVSSENSTELQNPLLTDDESGGTHIAVGIVLGLFAVLFAPAIVFCIFCSICKKNSRVFISGQLKEQFCLHNLSIMNLEFKEFRNFKSLLKRVFYPPTGPLTSAPRTNGRGDPPDSFVVGTSMVCHVRVNRSRTFCHPGTLVHDITTSAHQLVLHNPSIHTIIVHADVNDLKLQQSETLKRDFITLIHTIQQQNKQCIISGQLPSTHFGDIKFSRLQQLHIWLKRNCTTNNIPYVDNFTTLYNRSYLFRPDGIHPNRTGFHLLCMKIELTLRSTKLFNK